MSHYRRMPPVSVIALLRAVDRQERRVSTHLKARQLRDVVQGGYTRVRQPYIRKFSPFKARRQQHEAIRASNTPFKPRGPR